MRWTSRSDFIGRFLLVGGQAIVGAVNAQPKAGGGGIDETRRQPMQLPIHRAKRCHAHSKRTGKPCRSPAVKRWNVCRMHGAGGGAPKGKRNGKYRHGGRRRLAA
jgi:hypothetical protein